MTSSPETRYATSPNGRVAYQVFGKGEPDLVLVPDWLHCIELIWEEPRAERFLSNLAGFSRAMLFDPRGAGVSDSVPSESWSAAPTIELAAEDIGSVMNAAGSERAVILGIGIGCWSAILFAATAPSKVAQLVLVDGFPQLAADEDYPIGLQPEAAEHFVDWIIEGHGSGRLLRLIDPKAYEDLEFRRWFARFERVSMRHNTMSAFWRSIGDIKLRGALSAVSAPTLVLNRRDSSAYPVKRGRYLAERIPGAEFRELPGGDELFFMSNPSPMLAEVRQFVTGDSQHTEVDRVLATILFTDIVGSTEKIAALGDRDWRDQLLRHRAAVRSELKRFRGREVDTAGDGFLATFDGPARAVRCALAIRNSAKALDLEIRAGIHSGECELIGDSIAGIAVHTAARVMGCAKPGEILVSRTVKDLVAGSGLAFEERGSHTLKGVPDRWELFCLSASSAP